MPTAAANRGRAMLALTRVCVTVAGWASTVVQVCRHRMTDYSECVMINVLGESPGAKVERIGRFSRFLYKFENI